MAGIIKLTTRRLPQKVLNLGIRNVLEDIIEVRSAGTSRLICRQLITASSQKLYNDVYSNNQSRQRLPNSTGYCYGIRNIHMTTRLLQSELVNVPPFADSVSEGDVKFTVKVGDTVAVDEVVMEIETDKTTVGVPAPFNGIIEEIFVKDGDTVKAGQQLFKIKKTEGGAAPPPKKAEAAAPPPPPPPPPPAKPAAAAPPPPPPPPTPQPAAAAPKPPPPPPPKPTGPMHEIPVAAIRHAQGIQQPTVKSEKMIQVPPFADSVSEGDVKFTVSVGDIVKIDQVVMEIETDKTTVGIPAPFNGVILEILVKDGDTVKAGQNLFKIGEIEGDAKSQSQQVQKSVSPPSPSSLSKQEISRPPEPSSKQDKSKPPQRPPRTLEPPPKRTDGQKSQSPSSPPSSKIPPAISSNLHVKVPPQDYSREITGTRTEQRVKMNRMRQKIASRLKEAQNVNAMLTTFNEIDMSSIMEFRKVNQEAFQKKYGIKFGFMSIFCKASAYALQDQPVVNAVIDGTEIVYRDYVDISVAVATPKGLVVPVIRNVESMNYADIEIALAALGEKARKGAIAVEDMDGGTFTISNGGVFGSLMGTPIINPPQSAILGMHGVFDRPIAVKGQVVIRPMMYIALTYDHRLIDGREAVMFLRKIKAAVEDPRIIVAGL